jgi:ribosomal protein L37AE/L43A
MDEIMIDFHMRERDINVILPCDDCGKDSKAFASNEDGTWECEACVKRFS